jgi:hypothetical protein
MTEQEELQFFDNIDEKIVAIAQSMKFYTDKAVEARNNRDQKTYYEFRNRLKKEAEHSVKLCDSIVTFLKTNHPNSPNLSLAIQTRDLFQQEI